MNPWLSICRYELSKVPTFDPNNPFRACNLGELNDLREVAALACWFDIKYSKAIEILNALGVPRLLFGDREFFNVNALEQAIFILSELGAPGFQLRRGQGKRRRHLWPSAKTLRPAIEPLDRLSPEWASVLQGSDLRERMDAVLRTRRALIVAEVEGLTKAAEKRGDGYLRRMVYNRARNTHRSKGDT